MDSDYIAILTPAEGDIDATFPHLADTLHAMGMRVRYASGSMTLFGTDGLSMLSLPGGRGSHRLPVHAGRNHRQ